MLQFFGGTSLELKDYCAVNGKFSRYIEKLFLEIQ